MLGEGGSPTFSPGTDAGRVCPKALHDAEPTKHTQPFTGVMGLGIVIINQKFISKTDFFYNLRASAQTDALFMHKEEIAAADEYKRQNRK